MKRKQNCLHAKTGFSLVELMVGTVIFLAISTGAYKVFTSSTREADQSQKSAKQSRGMKQFFERFRQQVENAVQLPNAETTMLRVARPNTDSTQRDCVNENEPAVDMGWGLIPLPGRNAADITNSLASFDPSISFNETTKVNDGVRMVYVPEDSAINYLAYQTGSTPYPTSGGEDIVVESPVKNLQIGDFAVVADAFRKDLIRITNITPNGGRTNIEHLFSKSAWNMNPSSASYSGYNYGVPFSSAGHPVIYKVKVITYAVDATQNTLMMDDHTKDDGFTQPNTWGTRGLALNWQVVSPGVRKFQVIYVPMLYTGASLIETRSPQAGYPSKEYGFCAAGDISHNCDCHNQLGNPNLRTIKVEIEYEKPGSNSAQVLTENSVQEFNPTILKKELPGTSSSSREGCQFGGLLYTTLEDGSPNPHCNTTDGCFCTDRALPSLCPPPPPEGTGCLYDCDNDGIVDTSDSDISSCGGGNTGPPTSGGAG